MIPTRILFGLDRLPTTMADDDERLPGVQPSAAPLRLNSVPVPPDAWGSGSADHTARMAALRGWLLAGCGDYNGSLQRAVSHYLDAIQAHVAEHRDVLAQRLAPFHGLYRIEDWCWSALRPRPRAWWRHDDRWERADLAFWDGTAVIAMNPRECDGGVLPPSLRNFWDGQVLPVSPFRRPFPFGAGDRPQIVISRM